MLRKGVRSAAASLASLVELVGLLRLAPARYQGIPFLQMAPPAVRCCAEPCPLCSATCVSVGVVMSIPLNQLQSLTGVNSW